MDTGELDGVFRLFTTAELVIAAGALFNRLIIAALLFDLWPCAVPAFAQETKREREGEKIGEGAKFQLISIA